jgi:DNA-directed RNA polymerase alpha subunit
MKIVTTTEVTISVEDLEKWVRENQTIPEDLMLEKVINVTFPKEIKFLFVKRNESEKIAKVEMSDDEREKFLDTKFEDMNSTLTSRTSNCLRAADIRNPRDLCAYSAKEFSRFKNFGRKSLREIGDFMEKYDITFAPH